MKDILALVGTIAIIAFSCIMHSPTETKPEEYSYAEKLELIEVINSYDLTWDQLENRNGKLIIERCVGYVVNAETGEGKCYGIDNEWQYINYSRIDGIKNGDIICSFMVYNPDNNHADDITDRYDYIIQK